MSSTQVGVQSRTFPSHLYHPSYSPERVRILFALLGSFPASSSMADFLSKLWGAPEPVRPLTPSFAYTVPTSISQQTDEEEPLLVDDLEELVAPRTDPPRKKLSQSDLSKSEISLTRTWSPYRNLLVFLCTILLWYVPFEPFAFLKAQSSF